MRSRQSAALACMAAREHRGRSHKGTGTETTATRRVTLHSAVRLKQGYDRGGDGEEANVSAKNRNCYRTKAGAVGVVAVPNQKNNKHADVGEQGVVVLP